MLSFAEVEQSMLSSADFYWCKIYMPTLHITSCAKRNLVTDGDG